jgi:hypothetical protein
VSSKSSWLDDSLSCAAACYSSLVVASCLQENFHPLHEAAAEWSRGLFFLFSLDPCKHGVTVWVGLMIAKLRPAKKCTAERGYVHGADGAQDDRDGARSPRALWFERYRCNFCKTLVCPVLIRPTAMTTTMCREGHIGRVWVARRMQLATPHRTPRSPNLKLGLRHSS